MGAMIYGLIVIGIIISFINIKRCIHDIGTIQLSFVKITSSSLKRLIFLGLATGVVVTIGDHQVRFSQVYIDDQRLVYDQIFAICKVKSISSHRKDLILFWPTAVPVPALALKLRGEVEGLKIVLPHPQVQLDWIYETNIRTLERVAISSDIIVIPDDELAMKTKAFPITQIIRPFREWLSANSQFRQVSELAIRPAIEIGLRGGKIFIFENDHRLAAPH